MGRARVSAFRTASGILLLALGACACSGTRAQGGNRDAGGSGLANAQTSDGGVAGRTALPESASGGAAGEATQGGVGGSTSDAANGDAGESAAGGLEAAGGVASRSTGGAPGAGGTTGGTQGSGGSTGGTQGSDGTTGGTQGSGGSTGGAPETGGAQPAAQAPPSCEDPGWDPADFATVYDVGPGHPYAAPSEVPWESIGPGTLVRIHWRDTPYADKWVLAVAATAEAPVVVLGVPSNGLLPEITGAGAVTRPELDYWSDTRGIIKVGGSSVPDLETAAHVVVECLDISGAREESCFTDDAGAMASYDANASAIFLESGDQITLRNNRFHDCGNGLFVAQASSNVLVSGNQIYENGNVGSIYEHNSYTEAHGITFEYNYYGELCAGCTGNNLKDRSSGLVIRYNWIEGGNRALDLVDSAYDSINGAADYDDTFVYGNVLIELDGGNRQIIHYGGDDSADYFRTGTLYFFHNTVVSERSDLATVVRLSSAAATLDARNNIFYALGGGDQLGILEDAGTATLQGNWLPTGWREGSPSLIGSVAGSDNQEGADPGFTDGSARDYTLTAASTAIGLALPLATAATAHPVTMQFAPPSSGSARPSAANAGAFE